MTKRLWLHKRRGADGIIEHTERNPVLAKTSHGTFVRIHHDDERLTPCGYGVKYGRCDFVREVRGLDLPEVTRALRLEAEAREAYRVARLAAQEVLRAAWPMAQSVRQADLKETEGGA